MGMRSPVRLLMFGQLSLLVFMLVCFLLIPHFLLESNEGGVSNYGVHAKTVIPYTLAFGLCGVLTMWAAWSLPAQVKHRQMFRWLLVCAGGLYLLVLVTTYTYKVNNLLDNMHIYSSVALFLLEMVAAPWLVYAFTRDTVQFFLLAIVLVGFVLSTLTYYGHLHVLFIGELVTGVGFGVLLIRTARLAIATGQHAHTMLE